jgi:hypothetical protein
MLLAREAISSAVRATFQMPTSAMSASAYAPKEPLAYLAPIVVLLTPETAIAVVFVELPPALRYAVLLELEAKTAAP